MKPLLRPILPLAAAIALAACGENPQEQFSAAEKAFSANRFGAALSGYQAVLREQPGNTEAMDRLVRVYLALEDPLAAIGLLDRMASAGKPPADAPALYGQAELMMGQFDSALERVADAHSAEDYRIRAVARLGKGETDKAARAFALGVGAQGPKGRLYADYAGYLLGEDELEAAASYAQRAVSIEPVRLEALMVNADIAKMQDKPEAALGWFERALKAYPESRPALIGKIGVLGELKRIDELRPIIRAVRKADPRDKEFIFLEARLEAETGKWEKVREILQPHELELAGWPSANLLYAKSLLELGHAEQVRVKMKSHLLREPDSRPARLLLAQAELAVGDAHGAMETVQPLAERDDATKEELGVMAQARSEALGGA